VGLSREFPGDCTGGTPGLLFNSPTGRSIFALTFRSPRCWAAPPAGLGSIPDPRAGPPSPCGSRAGPAWVAAYELMELGLRPVATGGRESSGGCAHMISRSPGVISELGVMRFRSRHVSSTTRTGRAGERPVPEPATTEAGRPAPSIAIAGPDLPRPWHRGPAPRLSPDVAGHGRGHG